MSAEQLMEWELEEEAEEIRNNLPQGHFVHQNPQNVIGIEPGPPRRGAGE
jgi:hypothetical protein